MSKYKSDYYADTEPSGGFDILLFILFAFLGLILSLVFKQ